MVSGDSTQIALPVIAAQILMVAQLVGRTGELISSAYMGSIDSW